MSDELMRQIKQTMEEQRLKAFDEGWEAGYHAVWESLTDVVRTKAIDRKRPALNDVEEAVDVAEAPVEAPAADAPRLTRGQQRALAFIREHPGLKSHEIKGIGKGTLQGLINAGILVKRGPQFYAAEHN